jgi:hypothetical protein
VAARLLGYTGVWIDMAAPAKSGWLALTRFTHNNLTPAMLAGDDYSGRRAALVRATRDELMVAVAGLIAEVALAGYQTDYVEKGIVGRAAHVARLEAGLPICGYTRCRQPLVSEEDYQRIFRLGLPICSRRRCQAPAECTAYVVDRAENEVLALLNANWSIVKRVANALCKQDKLTSAELDILIAAGKRRRPKRKLMSRHGKTNVRHERVRNGGPSTDRARAS